MMENSAVLPKKVHSTPDLCEECEIKHDVKHILLYCNRGILQESQRIFTNNYKQYVPGFVNLCDDKKLKEILNVHPKCNE